MYAFYLLQAFFVFFSKPEVGDYVLGFRRLASAQNLTHE
mgnify:CR=1 FL=1